MWDPWEPGGQSHILPSARRPRHVDLLAPAAKKKGVPLGQRAESIATSATLDPVLPTHPLPNL